MTSFKAFMKFKTETPKSNNLSFATHAEADSYGADLLSRWMQPIGYEVRDSEQEPNCVWDAEAHAPKPISKTVYS